MARQFPGGYKKTEFDKKQDKLAAQTAAKIRAQHLADLALIEKAAEDKLNEIKLREAAEKYNTLMEGQSPKKRKAAQKAA